MTTKTNIEAVALSDEQKKQIAAIVHRDCTLIPGANFYTAAELAIQATVAQLNRALLASKPAVPVQDEIADGELIADLIEQNRTLRARLAAPASPSGEDAANVAIGEREAFEAAHKHLDLSMESDAWGRAAYKHTHVHAMWKGWEARAALTAEKVAAEPKDWRVGLFYSSSNPQKQVRVLADGQAQIAEYEKHRSFVRWIDDAAAQPVAQTLALTDEQREAIKYARSVMGSVSWETSDSRHAKQVLDALLTAAQPASSLAEGGERADQA